jgi:hypothetical protein
MVCPSPDSLLKRPYVADRAAAAGAGVRLHIRESLGDYRFVTFIVDSQFVLPPQPTKYLPTDSASVGMLDSLPASDIASITILKEVGSRRWSTCAGVPVVLILTKSKRWRPPSPSPAKP